MAASSSSDDIFDVQRIRRLVELMQDHNLSELDLRQGDTRIQIRRGSDAPSTTRQASVSLSPAVSSAAAEPTSEASATAAGVQHGDDHEAIIRSPMVGTFYTAPDPDSPPYVKVGDHVGPDTTVCIVEAMKVFNQIPAEVSGKILAVLVDNGEPVEYGQPMFKVDTRE
jgi:acetyl-CoA carboxylase biotin carboxyl carrier protein